MKKITKRNKIFWLSKRKHKRRRRRKIDADVNLYKGFVRVKTPETFWIANNFDRENLLLSINQIRYWSHKMRKNVLIDFTDTLYLVADGTLLFYAEIIKLKSILPPDIKLRCLLPKFSTLPNSNKIQKARYKVAQVLQQVGILSALNSAKYVKPIFEDVIYWRSAHGFRSEGGKTEPLLDVIDNLLGKTVSKKIYTGLAEAMTNSFHHAYEGVREDGTNAAGNFGWWMFMQVRDEKLSLLVCDLGIGIPTSLPSNNSFWLHDLVSIAPEFRDSTAIKFAAEHGSTSTNLTNRGKGLKKMRRIVEEIPGSSLRIFSNKGKFDAGRTIELLEKDYKTSIKGTMIIWTLDLKEAG